MGLGRGSRTAHVCTVKVNGGRRRRRLFHDRVPQQLENNPVHKILLPAGDATKRGLRAWVLGVAADVRAASVR